MPRVLDFYSSEFLINELKIRETEVYDFLDYLDEQGETEDVLKSENELRILEFLIHQSKVFNDMNPEKER